MNILFTEAGIQRCSVKNVLLEISQNSQENTCDGVSFLIKLQALGLRPAATLLKKRLWHRCFPVNFAKFIRAPFLTEHLWWLLLIVICIIIANTNYHSSSEAYLEPCQISMISLRLVSCFFLIHCK